MSTHSDPRTAKLLAAASAVVAEWDAYLGLNDDADEGHGDGARFGLRIMHLDNALQDYPSSARGGEV